MKPYAALQNAASIRACIRFHDKDIVGPISVRKIESGVWCAKYRVKHPPSKCCVIFDWRVQADLVEGE